MNSSNCAVSADEIGLTSKKKDSRPMAVLTLTRKELWYFLVRSDFVPFSPQVRAAGQSESHQN